uniref:Uncharacterized protein n=1 Tax=Steinernema glaseri TaxID=37863 RepID=A0A1I7YR49_9BILA
MESEKTSVGVPTSESDMSVAIMRIVGAVSCVNSIELAGSKVAFSEDRCVAKAGLWLFGVDLLRGVRVLRVQCRPQSTVKGSIRMRC